MDRRLEGKTILVTGGGKGIGREIARMFGQAGCNIAICGRNEQKLQESAQQFKESGFEVMYRVCDVSDAESCRQLVQSVLETYGGLDILVNNAGMTMRGRFQDISLELFHRIEQVNFGGAVNMSHIALPHILERGGSIVFISSLAGLKGLPAVSPYCTSKMALTALAESLRMEMSPQVHIGLLYVSFTENDADKTMYNEQGDLIPLKRSRTISSQSDVAKACRKLVVRRKRKIVLTIPGKILYWIYRIFPGFSESIITKFASGSSMYAYEKLKK